jgi:hypothetical protein
VADKVRSDLWTRLNFGFTVIQNWGEALSVPMLTFYSWG